MNAIPAALPSPEVLTQIVSRVTETMFGISFSLEGADNGGASAVPNWRTVVLPIPGVRALTVAIASDEPSSQMLGGAMFCCPREEVDMSMAEDSLRELVNIVAGQIKSVMGVDAALGLPRLLSATELPVDPKKWRSATIRGGGKELMVWVAVSETA